MHVVDEIAALHCLVNALETTTDEPASEYWRATSSPRDRYATGMNCASDW